jgi:hypothetical protein
MLKRRVFLIKCLWHDKGTIRSEWTVFRNLLGFFGDKEQSVEFYVYWTVHHLDS